MAKELKDPLENAIREIDAKWDGTISGGSYRSEGGDCVFFFNEAVAYYRDRVDSLLTVYRAFEGGRIIGLQVKGVAAMKADSISVGVCSTDHKPELDVVMLLLLTYTQVVAKAQPDNEILRKYAEAIRTASRRAA